MQVSISHIYYIKRSVTKLRNDKQFVKLHGKCKAFFKRGNLTCCLHIHQHFELYKERCKKGNIPVHHWVISQIIWKEMEGEKEAEAQGQLMKKQQ